MAIPISSFSETKSLSLDMDIDEVDVHGESSASSSSKRELTTSKIEEVASRTLFLNISPPKENDTPWSSKGVTYRCVWPDNTASVCVPDWFFNKRGVAQHFFSLKQNFSATSQKSNSIKPGDGSQTMESDHPQGVKRTHADSQDSPQGKKFKGSNSMPVCIETIEFPQGAFDEQSFQDYLSWSQHSPINGERSIQTVKNFIRGTDYIGEKDLSWQALLQLATFQLVNQSLSPEDDFYILDQLHHVVFSLDHLTLSRPLYLLTAFIEKNPEKYLRCFFQSVAKKESSSVSSSGKNELSIEKEDLLEKLLSIKENEPLTAQEEEALSSQIAAFLKEIEGKYSPEVFIWAFCDLKKFKVARLFLDNCIELNRKKGPSFPWSCFLIARHFNDILKDRENGLKYLDYAENIGASYIRYAKAFISLQENRTLQNEETLQKILEKNSEEGCLFSQTALGEFYERRGVNRAPDYARAAKWYQVTVDQEYAPAQYSLGLLYKQGHIGLINGSPNYAEAAKLYQAAANQGLARAQCSLGVLHDQGRVGLLVNGSPNYAEAAKWYQAAANQGLAIAQYNLGLLYELGQVGRLADGSPNYAEAAKWYQAAANQRLANAQCNLGILYDQGQVGRLSDGLPNYAEAAKWYRAAANQGHARAQCNLGLLHAQGQVGRLADGSPNYAEAARWFQAAANQGHAPAQCNLGLLHAQGEVGRLADGSPNYAEAAKLYQAAANQGNANAQDNFGLLYDQGQVGRLSDGSPNYAEAARWYQAAANQGLAPAQFNLGVLYARGHIGLINGSPNYAEAARWLQAAANQGHEEAQESLLSSHL